MREVTQAAKSRPNIYCLQSHFCANELLWHWSRTYLGILLISSWDKRLLELPSSAVGHFYPVNQQHWSPHPQSALTSASSRLVSFSFLFWWRPKTLQAPVSRDGSVSAVKTRARCYCRPLLSNPLLQFPQWKLHLSVRLTAPCLGLLQFIIYAQARYAPKKNDSACRLLRYMSCVYLGDLNPAGTGGRWGSRSRSWGPTATEIARPCRRRPCR